MRFRTRSCSPSPPSASPRSSASRSASTRPRGRTRSSTAFTALLSVSLITLPYYIAGLFLLLLFLGSTGFPAMGTGSFSDPVDYARHLALPATALALTWIGYIARLVRTSMLEVLGQNYIRSARAFGLRERLIFYKYALKNAVIPTVAVLGVGLGELMGGAVFVEMIFTRPGLGRSLVEAIATRNFPIVQGAVLVIAARFHPREPGRRPLLPAPRSPRPGRGGPA